jgi:Na+/proline symporter
MIPLLVLAYLLALIGYGAWHSRQIKTQEDFAVAGRSLTGPVLLGTMLATWIGTGSLVGNAEKTYEIGLSMMLVPIGGAIGLFVLSFVATRVRQFGQLTVQDILEARFGLLPRVLGTIAIITAYLTIVSYQYRAGGAVIHTMYPGLAEWCNNAMPAGLLAFLREQTAWTDASWGSVLAAMFIIGYTVLGGLVSVAYTDVVNGVVMILGIAIGLPLIFNQAGGFAGLETAFAGSPGKLELFGPIGWVHYINLSLPALLLVMGEANLYQRFFAAKNVQAARWAATRLVPAVFVVELAIIAFALVASAIEQRLPEEQYGHVILIVAMRHLTPLLAAAVLAAAVAIIVSTADSFLLVSANSVVRDVYHRFIKPDATPTQLVAVSRGVVVLLGLLAFVASLASKEFLSVALWAYTIYGASITPALMATFFWKRATGAGAAAGIAGGTLVTIGWDMAGWNGLQPRWLADLELEAVLPAMAVSVLLLVIVSWLTRPPRQEQIDLVPAAEQVG